MDKRSVHFLYEVGLLAQIQRSGLAFLGFGRQSVAEHSFRVAHVALILSRLHPEKVDEAKLLRLCLFHDVPEVRTGDHHYVNRRYVTERLADVLLDLEQDTPYGRDLSEWVLEFEKGDSPEAQLARDADQLEMLLFLKEQRDKGYEVPELWIRACRQRILTKTAQALAEVILTTRFDEWWQHRWSERGEFRP